MGDEVTTIQVPNPAVFGDFLTAPHPKAARLKVGPGGLDPDQLEALGGLAGAPAMVTVKLGAVLTPPEKRAPAPRLAKVLNLAKAAMVLPPATDYYAKCKTAIGRMY